MITANELNRIIRKWIARNYEFSKINFLTDAEILEIYNQAIADLNREAELLIARYNNKVSTPFIELESDIVAVMSFKYYDEDYEDQFYAIPAPAPNVIVFKTQPTDVPIVIQYLRSPALLLDMDDEIDMPVNSKQAIVESVKQLLNYEFKLDENASLQNYENTILSYSQRLQATRPLSATQVMPNWPTDANYEISDNVMSDQNVYQDVNGVYRYVDQY